MKRFVIRDSETKEVIKGWDGKILLDFDAISAAKTYYSSISFGMNLYYEIYDTLNKEVIFKKILNVSQMGRTRKEFKFK